MDGPRFLTGRTIDTAAMTLFFCFIPVHKPVVFLEERRSFFFTIQATKGAGWLDPGATKIPPLVFRQDVQLHKTRGMATQLSGLGLI